MSNQPTIEPKDIKQDAGPMLIAGLSKNYLFDDPMNPSSQWKQLNSYLSNTLDQKEQVTYGICFNLDDGRGIEYVCGIEVADGLQTSELSKDFVLKRLPSFSYAVFEHKGHVSSIRQTCDTIWKEWIPQSGYGKPREAHLFFERYGEGFDPQTGKGDIEIWIPIE